MNRKVVPLLSRDERKLVELYRQSIPFAKELIMSHAVALANESAKHRVPFPSNLLPFRRPESRL